MTSLALVTIIMKLELRGLSPKSFSFYRATRMHSADYAVAKCPSVRQSVCRFVCHTPLFCLNG